MGTRWICLMGLGAMLSGCALEPLKYRNASAPGRGPGIGMVCVKTNYTDGCRYISVQRLRTDPQWRMLLGDGT
jgi:hypothetical protein